VRRHGRIDANQHDIVDALRSVGASVVSLASIGDGCPDLLVGWRERNYLLEVKDGNKPVSQQALTPDQLAWVNAWRGQWARVTTIAEAFSTLGIKYRA